jgi:preprotein translocase subunit SecF
MEAKSEIYRAKKRRNWTEWNYISVEKKIDNSDFKLLIKIKYGTKLLTSIIGIIAFTTMILELNMLMENGKCLNLKIHNIWIGQIHTEKKLKKINYNINNLQNFGDNSNFEYDLNKNCVEHRV